MYCWWMIFEVLPLVIVRVGVVEELFQRDGEDEDVGLAIPVRGVDVDLAVLAGDASDVNVAFGRVLQGGVEVLEHRLGAVGPRPQISLGKGHHGDEVEVLQHVGGRDVVEVPVAEGREGLIHRSRAASHPLRARNSSKGSMRSS